MGQAISQIGSQVSFLALPLVATLSLGATPFQMGLLTAASSLPSLLVGLHAGALVDRHRRRPVLIAGDIGRAALLGLIPLAWATGMLSMELLYAVALLGGALTLFFDVAYQAFLPTLVDRDQLVDGNSKLELSRTAAEIAGPSLAGWLVHLLTGPVAVALDAVSYLLSALLLWRIRVHEPAPSRSAGVQRLWEEIREGLQVVVRDPRLRALVGGRGLLDLFNAMLEAVFVLYIVRALGIGPALIGFIFTVGGVGFLVGALLPNRASYRFGFGTATVGGIALVGLSDLLVPLASGSLLVVVPLLVTAQFLFGLGLTVFNVNQASLRQAIVPGRLQGRASATVHFLATGMVPLGAVLGGILGELIGLRATLVVAACGELLAALWIWNSPLRTLRELPPSIEEVTLQTT
ncbi:MAG: MFS transporter [Rhizobiales bacterium]|nr:MFS transporter [Hyphomicrobiales bacterium]